MLRIPRQKLNLMCAASGASAATYMSSMEVRRSDVQRRSECLLLSLGVATCATVATVGSSEEVQCSDVLRRRKHLLHLKGAAYGASAAAFMSSWEVQRVVTPPFRVLSVRPCIRPSILPLTLASLSAAALVEDLTCPSRTSSSKGLFLRGRRP